MCTHGFACTCVRPLPFHLFDPVVEGASNSFHLRAKVPGEPFIPPSPIVLLERGHHLSGVNVRLWIAELIFLEVKYRGCLQPLNILFITSFSLGITANSTKRNFTREMSSKNRQGVSHSVTSTVPLSTAPLETLSTIQEIPSVSLSGSDFGLQTWLYLWHSRLMVPDLNSLDLLKPISGFQVQDFEIFTAFATFMASLLPIDRFSLK
ncbi:hypothetical protein VNO77_31034 [Canavalia gladiata]|uniref:Uncharacterized protein n=1 Tax=Canavalia gladiata TaxID=3824 RepID=A0AAN9KPE0_CANGL